MKRAFSLIISFCLLFSISGKALAVENLVADSGGSGLKMTVNSFVRDYTGDTSGVAQQMGQTVSLNQMESVSYEDFTYDAESHVLSFGAIIYDGECEYPIEVTGVLYNSWKKDYGINSMVGDMTTNDEAFEVLAFEIYNDDDASLVNETFLSGSRL